MKQIDCSGSPYEIGLAHGRAAVSEIASCVSFYADTFDEKTNMSWTEVHEQAAQFSKVIAAKWPSYFEEMKGIAIGANRNLLDVVALNVRSEIMFGRFSDGCTSAYCAGDEYSYLGQNWDWNHRQLANLVHLTIRQQNFPVIQMITEAGIIGKIGMNDRGVGVCLNAIRARGLSTDRLPVHLALRAALESLSASRAVASLERQGVASSAHILIADAGTAIGLEVTATTTTRVPAKEDGTILHTNHLLMHHPGVDEPPWLDDSPVRMETMQANLAQVRDGLCLATFAALFENEENFPMSINRAQVGQSTFETIFNIVMDLKAKTAVIRIGRPMSGDESPRIEVAF